MSAYIKIFEHGSEAREKLNRAAHILTGLSPKGYRYYVGETYFDFGQNWKWTTPRPHAGAKGGEEGRLL